MVRPDLIPPIHEIFMTKEREIVEVSADQVTVRCVPRESEFVRRYFPTLLAIAYDEM